MPTREELQEAYMAFRLPVGVDWKTIKKRYKLLVKAWHPDKQGGQGKEEVEQELKEYNHFYNDVFKIHFESEHSENSECICQPERKAQQEPIEEQFQQENSVYEQPVEEIDPEIELRSQRRRWQASIACILAFIGILAYGFIGSKIKSVLPAQKTETINSQPIPVSTPSINSSTWRAPYQSISTPITPSQSQAIPASKQNNDDTRRAITVNENKMVMLQQDIDSLKAQIKIANPTSAGILYRDLGGKEQELASLRQRTQYLKMGLTQ